jgi:hypothetical protein
MIYKIRITETLERIIDVHADSINDAITEVKEKYDNNKIILNAKHIVDVRFEI